MADGCWMPSAPGMEARASFIYGPFPKFSSGQFRSNFKYLTTIKWSQLTFNYTVNSIIKSPCKLQPKIAIINRHNSLLTPLQLHCITLGWLPGAQCVIKVQSVVVATNYHIISIKTISATEHITLCNKIIDVTIFSWTLTSLLVSPKSFAHRTVVGSPFPLLGRVTDTATV